LQDFQKTMSTETVSRGRVLLPRIPTTLSFDVFQTLLLSKNPLMKLLAHALENVCGFLSLADCARLASSCKSLRPFMQHEDGVYYILQHMRPLNSQNTKRLFCVPRSAQLLKMGRAQYSQSIAFALGLQKHDGFVGLRREAKYRAVGKLRRHAVAQIRAERANMLRNALIQLHLPSCLAFTSREGIHYRNYSPVCPENMLEALLSNCVEGICFRWFLLHHTDYRRRLTEHIAVFGNYEHASAIIAAEYERPAVWPWMHLVTF
jgi:hypothetical protein